MINLSSHPIWKGMNPLRKHAHLARFFIAKQYAKLVPSSKIIGVIGAVGKTTTIYCCQAVLSEKFDVISTTETNLNTPNLDPIFNLPLTIMRARKKTDRVLLELGIELPGEMDLYLDFIKPSTVIVSKIDFEHSEFLGNLEQIISENVKALMALGEKDLAILNYDDPNCRKIAPKLACQVIFYGTNKENCHVWAGKVQIEDFRTTFELNYGVEKVEVKSNLLGVHQIYPMLAAAALGLQNELSLPMIKRGLEKVEGPPHRLKAWHGFNGSVVLDDTYNAQPVAMEEAIETLNQVPARRRIAVLGEMRELGSFSEQFHRQIAQKLVRDRIDLILLGGGDTRYLLDELTTLGFPAERMEADLKNSQIISKLLKILRKGDVVLIKGSRAVRLEEVVKRVIKKD